MSLKKDTACMHLAKYLTWEVGNKYFLLLLLFSNPNPNCNFNPNPSPKTKAHPNPYPKVNKNSNLKNIFQPVSKNDLQATHIKIAEALTRTQILGLLQQHLFHVLQG